MRYTLLLLLFVVSFKATSQEDTIEIIKASISANSKNDTNKVKALNALADRLKDVNHDTCIYLSHKALSLARILKWDKGIIKSLNNLSVLNEHKGFFDSTVFYANSAAELSNNTNDLYNLSVAYNYVGNGNYGLGRYKTALGFYSKALKIAEQIKNKRLISVHYSNMGRANLSLGDPQKSLECFQNALKISMEINDSVYYARILGKLGNFHLYQQEYDMAIKYYNEAAVINRKKNSMHDLSDNIANIGSVYSYKGDMSRALEYYFKSLAIEKKLNSVNGTSDVLVNIGNVYIDQSDSCFKQQGLDPKNRLKIVLHYYYEALGLKKQTGDQAGTAVIYLNLGVLYTGNDNRKSELMFDTCFTILNSTGSKYYLAECYRFRYSLDTVMKDNTQALYDYTMYIAYRDSLNNEKNVKKMTEMEMNFEFEKKEAISEKEKAEMELQQTRSNYILMGMTGLLILLILTGVLLLKQRRLKANQKNLEMEQQLLSAQMNPHFIFNALNSVQAFILEKSAHEASDYLAKFSKLVRLVLNNTREKVLTLEREIEFLRSYIELEQIRFGNKFTVEFVVDESIDTYQVLIPPMLIQPYIENAIWHGLMPLKSERQGKLRVSFTEEERQLTIVIEDNGIGIETSQQIKKSPGHVSTGMTLAETRTKMTGAASVKIYNLQNEDGTPAGTKVEIILTLK